jgi:hypothetical protein
MIVFELKHPKMTDEHLGFLPSFLSKADPRPAREQIDEHYQHGGGWSPFEGFTMYPNRLEYPGDRPMQLLAEARLRDERIRLYECDWVAIVQPDGSYEIARLD